MPALPWVQLRTAEPEREYVAALTRLPLRSYRFIPGFLRDTSRIRRQLHGTEGLIGYGLNAQLARKTFWTLSVWTDREALDDFAIGEPHRSIIGRIRPRMGNSRFEFFVVRGADAPPAWGDAMARMG